MSIPENFSTRRIGASKTEIIKDYRIMPDANSMNRGIQKIVRPFLSNSVIVENYCSQFEVRDMTSACAHLHTIPNIKFALKKDLPNRLILEAMKNDETFSRYPVVNQAIKRLDELSNVATAV